MVDQIVNSEPLAALYLTQGNAACMTYQSTGSNRSDEQCVASSVIAEAMKTL